MSESLKFVGSIEFEPFNPSDAMSGLYFAILAEQDIDPEGGIVTGESEWVAIIHLVIYEHGEHEYSIISNDYPPVRYLDELDAPEIRYIAPALNHNNAVTFLMPQTLRGAA